MEYLSDIASYCHQLVADKASDRKKSVEKLLQLLKKGSVLDALDKTSDSKASRRDRQITWDDILRGAVGYVNVETAVLQKAKEAQTATTLANREKRKQEISGVFKSVIRFADKRGPRLKCSYILKHLTDVLKDEYMCNAYGLDYSNILLKNLLTVRKYWTDITLEMWQELIALYCMMFMDADCRVDKTLLSRLIRVLISGATTQCDLRPKRLLKFFTDYFKNIRQEKTTGVVENLLSALNTFLRSIAEGSRIQLCKLGETTLISMLYLWENRPSPTLKNEVVEFLHLQMECHHPGGARRGSPEAAAIDWDVWMSHLKKLYEVIHGDLKQHGGRTKFSGNTRDVSRSRETELSSAYINLAADLCHQLFEADSRELEITQIEESSDERPRSKKRRLESGWHAIRDNLTSLGQSQQLVPWLHLTKRVVEKYPNSFPEDEFPLYLQCLSKLLAQCKRNDLMCHILDCLLCFVCYPTVVTLPQVIQDTCFTTWKKVWASTLRALSLQNAVEPSYRLLTEMLRGELVPCERDVWNLFLPSISHPTDGSVQFLITYMMTKSLPENYQPSLLSSMVMEGQQSYPLRSQLLDWLLPPRLVMDGTITTKPKSDLDPGLVGQALAFLVMKNPSCVMVTSEKEKNFVTNLERVYLQSSNDFPLYNRKVTTNDKGIGNKDNVLLSILLRCIEDNLKENINSLLDFSEPQAADTQSLAREACQIVKFLYWLLKYELVSKDSLPSMDVFSVLKSLLRKVSTFMNDIQQNQGAVELLGVLPWIQDMLEWEESDRSGIVIARLVRSLIPAKAVDTLLNIAHATNSKRSKPDANTSRAGASRRGRILEDFDDMDLDFDDMSAKDTTDDLGFDDGFGDSQDLDEAAKHGDGFESLLSPAMLADTHRVRVEATRVLCLWAGFDTLEMRQAAPFHPDTEQGIVKAKLGELLREDTFDPYKAVDLQLMKEMITYLTRPCQQLGDIDLDNMVDAIRQVAKVQRRDQDVSFMCLELLGYVARRLADEEDEDLPTKTKLECRDTTISLLSAFWKLQDDQYCCKVRLAIAKCIMNLLQVDPEKRWVHLSTPGGNEDTDNIAVDIEFMQYLSDPAHSIRMYAAQGIIQMFMVGQEKMVPRDRIEQDKAFDKIYEIVNESLDIQGRLTPERAHDERENRTGSVLTALGNIMCVSPVCEKKALFALCQLIKENDVEIKQIQNIIQKVSEILQFKDGHAFMADHLPYLLHQWLGLGYPVAEFPHQMAFCKTKQHFYKDHYKVIIPELIMKKNMADAKEIVVAMGGNWTETLTTCIPKVVVHILPLFAATRLGEVSGDETVQRRTAHATQCYDLLSQEATREVLETTIVSKLDQIVVNILMCLYDTDTDEFIQTGVIRDMEPEPNPPCFNTYMIKSTLDYLTKSFSSNNKSLVDVLSRKHDQIQKILLELAIKLTKEHRLHDKRRILMMYRLFCKLLFKEFDSQLGGSWAFIMREVMYRLIYILKDMVSVNSPVTEEAAYRENIACMALELLRDMCVTCMEICSLEFEKYLTFFVSSLVPVAGNSGIVGEEAAGLLRLVILDNYAILKQGIVSLDPFPDTEVFSQLLITYNRLKFAGGTFTLKQEIEHFLAVCEMTGGHSDSRIEGLQHLSQKLHSQKQEILVLGREEQDKSTDNLLCKLVCKLVHMALTSGDKVKDKVSQCLGEIGPVNMATVALPDVTELACIQEAKEVFSEDTYLQNYCVIFHTLNTYLVDQDVDIVEAASCVLKSMLCTKTGVDFSPIYKEKVGDRDHLIEYLHPFRVKKKVTANKKTKHSTNTEQFCGLVDRETLWLSNTSNHSNWVRRLTVTLIQSGAVKDEILALLEPICDRKTNFCEIVLPLLIHDILVQGEDIHKEVLSRQISAFFSTHCGHSNPESRGITPVDKTDSTTVCFNKDSIRTMLKVVQHLRQQERPKEGRRQMTAWDNNFWMDLNYLHVAKAALYCSAHFTTVLYSEIWCDAHRQQHEESRSSSGSQSLSQDFTQDTKIDSASSASTEVGINVQDLLMEAFQQIGDPDGLYGCGAGRLADTSSRVKTYEHENLWDKALVTYDIDMSSSSTNTSLGLLQALQNFGALEVLNHYFHGMSPGADVAPNVEELQYQSAWKAGQWTLDPTLRSNQTGYHQAVYSALSAVKEDHLSLASSAARTARLSVIERLGEGSMESARCLYPMLTDLNCVSQIENALKCNLRNQDELGSLLNCWSGEDENYLNSNDFEFLEPVYNIRITLLRLILNKGNNSAVSDCLQRQLLQLARLSSGAGRHQVAERAIGQLKSLEPSVLDLHITKLVEEANMFWARGEQNTAKHLMKDIIVQLKKVRRKDQDAAKYYAKVLCIYGNWLAETRSENPNVIMEDYLDKAVAMLDEAGIEDDVALDSYLALARYADSQYQHIVNYMKSSTFESKQNLFKKAQKEIESLKQVGDNTKEKYFIILNKQSKIDRQEIATLEDDKGRFLVTAVENYIRCLKAGDRHDLRVFRLTSLWFSNNTNQEINEILQDGIEDLGTYKLLPLMYQLATRMDTRPHKDQCPLFQTTLNKVIERTAMDHPHHTLFCILALAHAKKDADIFKDPNKKGKLSRTMSEMAREEEGRIEAAKNLVERLKAQKGNNSVANIVKDMEKLCLAYIELANYPVTKYKAETKPIPFPGMLKLPAVKDLRNIAVPTMEIPVDRSGNYTNITYIHKFQPTFKLAGGINLPKIISCIGSDGSSYRQLVKGRDDLRQDAVMQQVFSMVNNLLKKKSETRKRDLQIRQYKVIPLSQCSGLLEWCEGTLPIGEYLIGGKGEAEGAHRRYRPHDPLAMDSRRELAGVHAKPSEDKYKTFLEVCSKFRPVFRHFFMEKFPEPAHWYERRLAYTRSVATNSIVGYILGLGDRHVQNILVDCKTAELVHIDLGVAFEQGRILPTPETVPFRLTRDIVDGMGVSGVEGVFRRCCEKTMEVMHDHQEALLTILEVLLYDPINTWSMSPAKAYALQHRRDRTDEASELNVTNTARDMLEMAGGSEENRENVNKLAERVLLRLQQKLQGIEDGIQLSVAGQVNHLIQEARDPKNLSRLFPGWQPYL
ncbi:serine-protein kinase ATM-like [Pecten maximus]|uniref:serine-protein kinase ATM-like n=1 Tax=Pecten maximus TaxID=6579 RepID=UPI0014582211|nr:serine-protein kinase ATM-like [Pecten maximus]